MWIISEIKGEDKVHSKLRSKFAADTDIWFCLTPWLYSQATSFTFSWLSWLHIITYFVIFLGLLLTPPINWCKLWNIEENLYHSDEASLFYFWKINISLGFFFSLCVILLSIFPKGGKKYQIKGCAGQGGFAQVFKAYVDSNPDDTVALKVNFTFDKDHNFTYWTLFLPYKTLLADTKSCFPLGILHVPSTWWTHFKQTGPTILVDYDYTSLSVYSGLMSFSDFSNFIVSEIKLWFCS